MRVILLVLDGLGVGEMPDVARVRPQDVGANTFKHIVENARSFQIDHLLQLGLGCCAGMPDGDMNHSAPLASFGTSLLAHDGADSYLGHQEIMGTIPEPPIKTFMAEASDDLERELVKQGHMVTRPVPGTGLLLVDQAIVIGDNLEADPGLNINLTVATDWIDFQEALRIGRIVRNRVRVGRVIVFGGPGITTATILQNCHRRDNGQVGIDSPALGVYDEHLLIEHMGFGVDPERQAASILSGLGIPVVLLGKMADLIVCPGARRDPIVTTAQIMDVLISTFRDLTSGLIAATVQETDLAAHEGDVDRIAAVLHEVDRGLGRLLPEMKPTDALIVCADHGNDPKLSPGLHTREQTPLLVFRPGQPGRPLGSRSTLADIGATIVDLFDAPPTQNGMSIYAPRNP